MFKLSVNPLHPGYPGLLFLLLAMLLAALPAVLCPTLAASEHLSFRKLLLAGLILMLISLWFTINVYQFVFYPAASQTVLSGRLTGWCAKRQECQGMSKKERGFFTKLLCCGAVCMERAVGCILCAFLSLLLGLPWWHSTEQCRSSSNTPQGMSQDIPWSCTWAIITCCSLQAMFLSCIQPEWEWFAVQKTSSVHDHKYCSTVQGWWCVKAKGWEVWK